jgi:CBS domain-containing protein
MLARDLMTRNPAVVTPDESVGHAAALMRERDVGLLPVVVSHESMHPEGVLTDRDIVTRHVAAAPLADPRVGDCMTAGRIVAVAPDADVRAVVEAMARHRVRRVLVVDRDGRLVGVIAQADLARHLASREPETVAALLERLSMSASTRSPERSRHVPPDRAAPHGGVRSSLGQPRGRADATHQSAGAHVRRRRRP